MEKYESLESELSHMQRKRIADETLLSDNRNRGVVSYGYQHTLLQSQEEANFDLWNEESFEDNLSTSRYCSKGKEELDSTHSIFYLNAKRKFLKAKRVTKY